VTGEKFTGARANNDNIEDERELRRRLDEVPACSSRDMST